MKIVYTRPDGGISVVHAAPKEDLEQVLGLLTDEAYKAHVIERSIPADAINVTEMPDGWTPPADRTFRNAWKHDVDITVDMAKARDIHRDKLRAARSPLLDQLDVDYQRADERADARTKADIAAKKQALRDITADPRIEAAKTPDDLKAITLS